MLNMLYSLLPRSVGNCKGIWDRRLLGHSCNLGRYSQLSVLLMELWDGRWDKLRSTVDLLLGVLGLWCLQVWWW